MCWSINEVEKEGASPGLSLRAEKERWRLRPASVADASWADAEDERRGPLQMAVLFPPDWEENWGPACVNTSAP